MVTQEYNSQKYESEQSLPFIQGEQIFFVWEKG